MPLKPNTDKSEYSVVKWTARSLGYKGEVFTRAKANPTKRFTEWAADHLDKLPKFPRHTWDVGTGKYVLTSKTLDKRYNKPTLKKSFVEYGDGIVYSKDRHTSAPVKVSSGSLLHSASFPLPDDLDADKLATFILKNVPRSYAKKDRIQFAFERADGNSTSTMTTYLPLADATDAIVSIFMKNETKYSEAAPPQTLIVNWMTTQSGGVLPLIGSGAKRLQGTKESASAKWLIHPNPAQDNCFFRACILATECNKTRCKQFMSTLTSRASTKKFDMEKRMRDNGTALRAKNSVQIADLQNIVNTYKSVQHAFTIVVYDNLFRKVGEYSNPDWKRKPRRTVELQLRGDAHWVPLIRWADSDWTREEYEKHEGVEQQKKIDKAMGHQLISNKQLVKFLKKGSKEKGSKANKRAVPILRNTKFAAADIEAAPDGPGGHFTAYSCGIAWYEGKLEKYNSWEGLGCLAEFTNWLSENDNLFNTIYFHNGGTYDVRLLLRESWAKQSCPFMINKTLYSNDRYLKVELQNKKTQRKIKILDSYALLNQPLDAIGKSFKVPHAKLSGVIEHDKIVLHAKDEDTENGFIHWKNYTAKNSEGEEVDLDKYLKYDCICLLEVMEAYSKDIEEAHNLDVTKFVSASSLARAIYLANHYSDRDTPLFRLPDRIDSYCRRAYQGGRVEVFRLGKHQGKISYVDVTSLYPYIMTFNLPYGKGVDMNAKQIVGMAKAFTGFLRVRARTIDDKQIPLLPKKEKGKLIFPILENWTEMTIYSAEYHRGRELGQYEFEVLDGIFFNTAPHMRSFSESLVARKAECRARGDGAGASSAKTSVNSGYGIWGQDCKNRQQAVMYSKEDDHLKAYHQGRLVHLGVRENDSGYTPAIVEEDIESDVNVALAAAVTSLARCELHKILCTARDDLGEKLLYCDTDSMICTGDVWSHPLFRKRHVRDGLKDIRRGGEALGSTKNELTDLCDKKKPWHLHPRVIDGGLCFDTAWICGLKFYALEKKPDEYFTDTMSIKKAKGLSQSNGLASQKLLDEWAVASGYEKEKLAIQIKNSEKLCLDDYERLCAGTDLTKLEDANKPKLQAFSMQFRKPATNLCDSKDYAKITKLNIVKKFGLQYSKGLVSKQGWVEPLRI